MTDDTTAVRSWRVFLICCGRDDGHKDFATWQEADSFREAYCTGPGVGGNGHQRCGIITTAEAAEGQP